MLIDRERCTGCGDCQEICPVEAISLFGGVAVIDPDTCLDCEACVQVCPTGAISDAWPPVQVQPAPVQPAAAQEDPVVEVISSQGQAPWVTSALSYVGREIAPRLVDALVLALERRLERTSLESQGRAVTEMHNGSAGRRRRRRRAGWRS